MVPNCVPKNEELSIDQQMKISRDHNRKSPEEKKAANRKALGVVKKVKREKDTRTDVKRWRMHMRLLVRDQVVLRKRLIKKS